MLSTGSIKNIVNGENIENPVLQILAFKALVEDKGINNIYRLLLTDGKYYFEGFVLLGLLNDDIKNGAFKRNTIVELNEFYKIKSQIRLKTIIAIYKIRKIKDADKGCFSEKLVHCMNNSKESSQKILLNYVSLKDVCSEIKRGKEYFDCTIKIKVEYKSSPETRKKNGKERTVTIMIFQDNDDNKQKILAKSFSEKLNDKIQTDMVYYLTHFKVGWENTYYDDDIYEIELDSRTNIIPVLKATMYSEEISKANQESIYSEDKHSNNFSEEDHLPFSRKHHAPSNNPDIQEIQQQGKSMTGTSNWSGGFEQKNQPYGGSSSMAIHPISSLTPYQNRWTIRARVTNKSNIRTWSNSRGEGKLFSVDLLDESGEIRATAFNEQCDKFFDAMEVNKVYYISKGNLKTANKNFTSIKNDYEMSFMGDTTVVLCTDSSNSIPMIQFKFIPIDQLQNIEKDKFVDIIGVCKSASDVQSVTSRTTQKEFKKRDIHLVDKTGTEVTLTLWAADAEKFDGNGNPVIAVKGVRVSDFGGTSLSMINSSVLQINPDIREAHILRGWFDREGAHIATQSLSNQGSETVDQESIYSEDKHSNNFSEEDHLPFSRKHHAPSNNPDIQEIQQQGKSMTDSNTVNNNQINPILIFDIIIFLIIIIVLYFWMRSGLHLYLPEK